MKNKKLGRSLPVGWIVLIIVVLAGAGFFFRDRIVNLQAAGAGPPAERQPNAQEREFDPARATTTTVRPATGTAQVNAAGNIEVISQYTVVLQVEGIVTQMAVEVGDLIAAGDLLLALDTTDLERAVRRAELSLAASQTQLDQLMEPADPAELAAARVNLASAQANLAEVQAGPSAEELAAAEASLASTQQRYQELRAGQSEAELTQLSVELHKAIIALEQAQEAYDAIAFQDNIGSTSQAVALQETTIDYEAAKAAYEVATEPSSQADLQEALSAIQDARHQLQTLRQQPTAAGLAAAEAEVASAEGQLAQLLNGPGEAGLRQAEIDLEQVQLDLEEAQTRLAQAELRAPIAGTVMAVEVEIGQQVTSGLNAVILADLTALQLTANVAEVDISKIQPGQPAKITIDALPDRSFSGLVSRIAPASASEQGVVNYPVTIRITDSDMNGLRPGMTAVATILEDTIEAGWLVPTNALRERQGNSIVMVIRDGQPTPVKVTPGASQGEWTVVQTTDLHAGDEVVGGVSSFLNEDDARGRGFGFGRGSGAGGRGN